jgi:hypothetical protein
MRAEIRGRALARKLAVAMHAMLKMGELFDPTVGAPTV